MIRFKKIFFILLVLYSLYSFGQSKDIYISQYENRFENAKSVIPFFNKALQQSQTDDDKVFIHALTALTQIYLKDYQSVKENLDAVQKIGFSDEANISTAYFYFATARYYQILDENELALKALLKAFDGFKKLKNNDLASEIAVYIAYNSPEYYEKYIQIALDLTQNSSSISYKINAYSAYANFIKDNLNNPNKKYTTTFLLAKLKEVVDLIGNENQVTNKFYLATAYFNYGYNLLLNQDKSGFQYLDKALLISKKYKFFSFIRNYYGVKGDILLQENKTAEAKKLFIEGLQYAQSLPYKDKATLLLFFNSLKKIAVLEQDWKGYYNWDKTYIALVKEVNDEDSQKNIQNAIAKYELKEKETEIILLEQKNNFKKWLIVAITALGLICFLVFLFYRKAQKGKYKISLLEQQKIEVQKEQVQKELMAHVLHIEKKNEVLNHLKEKLINENEKRENAVSKSIFDMIEKSILVDDDFDKFKMNFNAIYPQFFDRLQQKSQNTLTPLDLKYCAFILMKLSNKEIASQMNVEPKSIRMARYRIKQKLQLAKNEDLDVFIQTN